MTNINCSSDCAYQKDGKCKLDNVTSMSVTTTDSKCIYFSKNDSYAKSQPDGRLS